MSKKLILETYFDIHTGIVELLENARLTTARCANAIMTASYWEIGRRIVEFEQKGKDRAIYGEALLKHLGEDLSRRFGRGFSWRNLTQMRAFYLAWPQEKILQTLSAKSVLKSDGLHSSNQAIKSQIFNSLSSLSVDLSVLAACFPLPWSAYVRLLSVKNQLARGFYEEESMRCGWSVRQLDRQISSQFFERMALSRNKAAMLQKSDAKQRDDIITPEQAIKDPFVLEFLALKDEYSENELEEALISSLENFLLELGDDFAFIGRQRRLRIDDTWFRVDLLFYHRRLKSLVIIDLKAGKFSYADAGQMHLYLNYAAEHWTKPGEHPPVGLILCADKGVAEVRYALENLPNKVLAAEYRTILPDEKLIADELERSRRELEESRRIKISEEKK
jgi:predicted nuclease of restriction endonuclease-like (RecB) superfamily